ncbi:MAG: PqqD family protein [Myxococcota bacterium]
MSTPEPAAQYRLDPSARFRVLDGEGIFILQGAGEVLVVNGVAAFIVERVTAEVAFDEVVAEVVARYDVQPDQAEADAMTLLENLVEAGALAAS